MDRLRRRRIDFAVNSAELRRLRRSGSLRAQRALRSLELDVEHPIDVFGAIQREQIWLMFQPLDRLYGAYDRRSEAAGIVVHALHPVRTQRFTAAHELGHHLLGHDVSIDSREFVEWTTADLPAQEVEAQAFAAGAAYGFSRGSVISTFAVIVRSRSRTEESDAHYPGTGLKARMNPYFVIAIVSGLIAMGIQAS